MRSSSVVVCVGMRRDPGDCKKRARERRGYVRGKNEQQETEASAGTAEEMKGRGKQRWVGERRRRGTGPSPRRRRRGRLATPHGAALISLLFPAAHPDAKRIAPDWLPPRRPLSSASLLMYTVYSNTSEYSTLRPPGANPAIRTEQYYYLRSERVYYEVKKRMQGVTTARANDGEV